MMRVGTDLFSLISSFSFSLYSRISSHSLFSFSLFSLSFPSYLWLKALLIPDLDSWKKITINSQIRLQGVGLNWVEQFITALMYVIKFAALIKAVVMAKWRFRFDKLVKAPGWWTEWYHCGYSKWYQGSRCLILVI